MDWALVLASQGVQPTITKDEEGWGLHVDESEYERATGAIVQYRRENRGWRGWHWEQQLPYSGLWFHWGSAFWCLWLVILFFWNHERFPRLTELGLMDNHAVRGGQWWRIFTAITLHADASHLAANASTGFFLFGLAMAHYGAGFGLMAAYLAGAGGNVLGYLIYSESQRSLGASGMVMGALGLIAVQTLAYWRDNPPNFGRVVWRSVGAAICVFMLLGFGPQSDILAHVGGFVFGCGFGVLLNSVPTSLLKNVVLNQLCVILTGVWVAFTWWLALK
jgi:membrane associated rhomboid family serine protease